MYYNKMDSLPKMKYIKTLSNKCWHCGANPGKFENFRKCTGCFEVRYCSKECQKNDWCAHKKICKNIEKLECSLCNSKTRKLVFKIINNIQQYVCKNCANDNSNENMYCFHD